MLKSVPVGNTVRPPWWRTSLYLLAAGFMSLFSLVFSSLSVASQQQSSGAITLLMGVGMMASVGLPVILAWRHRTPFTTALVAAGASLVVPIGNPLPLLALATLIGRRRGPAVWWVTGLVALASTWVTIADSLAQPRGASFWKAWLGPYPTDFAEAYDLPLPWLAIIIVAQLGLTIGAGLLVRSRREASQARQAVETEQEVSVRLGDEAARRQEREKIAREVHDAMGYRLSLLSLHAGALEANSSENQQMAQSAHLVRESATATMEDLRSLLDVLREPAGAELPSVSLADLAEVVQESYAGGQPLSSSIFIQDSAAADPALARAVYRIVQELLTNARKHAPGQPVFLSVTGNPSAGVVIAVRNRYTGSIVGPPGSSRGLTGVAERAQLLGGTVEFGVDGDNFRVHVRLPWR